MKTMPEYGEIQITDGLNWITLSSCLTVLFSTKSYCSRSFLRSVVVKCVFYWLPSHPRSPVTRPWRLGSRRNAWALRPQHWKMQQVRSVPDLGHLRGDSFVWLKDCWNGLGMKSNIRLQWCLDIWTWPMFWWYKLIRATHPSRQELDVDSQESNSTTIEHFKAFGTSIGLSCIMTSWGCWEHSARGASPAALLPDWLYQGVKEEVSVWTGGGGVSLSFQMHSGCPEVDRNHPGAQQSESSIQDL